jgi:hypothetical protein
VAPEVWSWAALGGRGAVAAQALSDEGADPGLTDRVGPPISEREAMAESDKRSRRRPNQTSGAEDGRIGQAKQAMGRLGRTGREEVGHGCAGLENNGGGRAEIKKKNF